MTQLFSPRNGRPAAPVREHGGRQVGSTLLLLLALAWPAVAQINITNVPVTNSIPSNAHLLTQVGPRTRLITVSTLLGPTLSSLQSNSAAGLALTGTFTGTITGNAAGLTNKPFETWQPQILLDPPHLGPSTNTGDHTVTGNNAAGTMFHGTGLIREVWIQCELGVAGNLNTNLANVRLEVFVDGGNTTNTNFRTIDVSLADLFGNRFRFPTNGHWAVDRDSFGLFTQDRSTNWNYGGYIKTMQLRLPIYFTNNCLIRLTNSATSALHPLAYINATVENAPTLDALKPFQTWRLRTATTYGAVAGGASNFLFTARGPGVAVGWLQSLSDPIPEATRIFVDSIVPTFLTAPGITWQMAGGDDLFFSTYAMKGGFSLGYNAGIINRITYSGVPGNEAMAVEGYRWFPRDNLYWTNTAQVYIPNCEALAAMSATLFYYAP